MPRGGVVNVCWVQRGGILRWILGAKECDCEVDGGCLGGGVVLRWVLGAMVWAWWHQGVVAGIKG